MKNMIGTLTVGLLLIPACLYAAESATDATLENQKEKLSYSMGLDLGKYLKGVGDELDLQALKAGIDDGYSGVEPKLSEEEMAAVKEDFAVRMQAEQEAEMAEVKAKNQAAGKAYLEQNREREEVTVTQSGLQYEVLEDAGGPTPGKDDTVKVDYVGTLIDGTEFDSSFKRGQPAVLPVGQVIPGWSEALQLMPVGSKYRVVIPAELAYGEQGAPPVIQPNSVLIFEIDLLGIEEE